MRCWVAKFVERAYPKSINQYLWAYPLLGQTSPDQGAACKMGQYLRSPSWIPRFDTSSHSLLMSGLVIVSVSKRNGRMMWISHTQRLAWVHAKVCHRRASQTPWWGEQWSVRRLTESHFVTTGVIILTHFYSSSSSVSSSITGYESWSRSPSIQGGTPWGDANFVWYMPKHRGLTVCWRLCISL